MTITPYQHDYPAHSLIHYSPDPKLKIDLSELAKFIKIELPPIEPIKFELLPIEPIKIELFKISDIDHDTILLARPVHELIAHLRDFKIPSFVLVARVIKTLVLAIFRWHLCDHVLLE